VCSAGRCRRCSPRADTPGDLVTKLVGEADVPYRRVDITESTRQSFTIDEQCSGQRYRFVLPGPRLSFVEQARCLDELRDVNVGVSAGRRIVTSYSAY